MFRKLILVSTLWFSTGISMTSAIDVFLGNRGWDLSPLTGGQNMMSNCISTCISSSRQAITQCAAADLATDNEDFTSKWRVSEDANAPEWMENGILLP